MITLAAAALLSATPAQAYIFSTNFNSGGMPRTITVTNAGQLPLASADYRYGYTDKGWTVEQVNDAGYAAICPTHTRSDKPVMASMTLPELTIEGANPVLRWKALSIFPQLPESYEVTVKAGDAEPTVIFSTEAENDIWTTRVADLSAWNGKQITISFTCTSVNRYLLAIDDIQVGDPEDILVAISDSTLPLVAYGGGTTTVSGTAVNLGKAEPYTALGLMSGDKLVEKMELDTPWAIGEEIKYSFRLPIELNASTDFSIAGLTGESTTEKLYSSAVYATTYPRTLVIDEGTGMWCNNCPTDGNLVIEELERKYGERLIVLANHVNDDLACQAYNDALQFRSLPRIMLNRIKDTNVEAKKINQITSYFNQPVDMAIEITDCAYTGSTLTATAAVRSASAFDNTAGRYRVGCTLITDFYFYDEINTYFYQQNMGGGTNKLQYHFLPSRILSDLAPMNNVVLSAEYAIEGIPGSIAETMQPDIPVSCTWTLSQPELLDDWQNGRLVAYIIDTENDNQIVNAAIRKIDATIGIDTVGAETATQAAPEYFNLQGMRVANPGAGIYIVRRGNKITKETIR